MGYDFYMLRKPDSEAVARLGYSPQDPDTPEYFRINSPAMAAMGQIMTRAGIFDTSLVQPEFPVWPPEGIPMARLEVLEPWVFSEVEEVPVLAPEESATIREIREQVRTLQAVRSPDRNLVPMFKFRSNNGWLLEPDECLLVAAKLESGLSDSGGFFSRSRRLLGPARRAGATPAEAQDWVRSWACFNSVAATVGGYRVF